MKSSSYALPVLLIVFTGFINPVKATTSIFPPDSLKVMQQEISTMIDSWHRAAAEADIGTYFGHLSEESRFLGTDPTEDWDKQAFYKAVKGAFQDAPAWNFTSSDRHIKWIVPGQVAHFYEQLDTWMGPCRGSGLVKNINGEWKITFYNLANTIPNKIVKDYINFYEEKTGRDIHD